ncbi:ornithine cyclodeaminase family protein [Sphingobacterium tabacisoli]|uniref:Ornithine cyclodeaminase family protein n=1 Tax=Sphingobacterium tabacisoli TaxID=2044855 RepID=A0ABW5L6B2_9SPHI|nr:ornithine cyclodeaminase family protein [Sphingobacterium tabacisoli]
MKTMDNKTIASLLCYDHLIEALKIVFRSSFTQPVRHHHFYTNSEGHENTLILMPSWNDRYIGIKQVVVAPNNSTKNLPAIHALYTVLDAVTGKPIAQMDAAELTSRRTACTSALAASYLARKNASTLLVVGSGKVAQHLVQAHSVVREYDQILLWARNQEKAKQMQQYLKIEGIENVTVVEDLKKAVGEADVISCATLSQDPIIYGDWIKAGTHLDLIGSHTPKTREADDLTILKSQIFVDSREGALHETGELAIPIETGVLDPKSVIADIVDLCLERHPGRSNENEVTLFKSAGLAIEDLAAALLVYEKLE